MNNEVMKKIVDIGEVFNNVREDTEKFIFTSLEMIKIESSEEYTGSATFSMVVDALKGNSDIFKINLNSSIMAKKDDCILTIPKTDM